MCKVPDNYSRFEIYEKMEEKRMLEVSAICGRCKEGFTSDEMYNEDYCIECYDELEEFDEISNQDIADLINIHTGLKLTADDVYDNMHRYDLIRIVPSEKVTTDDIMRYGVIECETVSIVYEI